MLAAETALSVALLVAPTLPSLPAAALATSARCAGAAAGATALGASPALVAESPGGGGPEPCRMERRTGGTSVGVGTSSRRFTEDSSGWRTYSAGGAPPRG